MFQANFSLLYFIILKYFPPICSHFSFYFSLIFCWWVSRRTLLRFHNLRAVILIVLCMIAACEISIAYLLMTHTNDRAAPYETMSTLFFLLSIISTAILLRLIEVRKSHSGEHDLMDTIFFITHVREDNWTYFFQHDSFMSVNKLDLLVLHKMWRYISRRCVKWTRILMNFYDNLRAATRICNKFPFAEFLWQPKFVNLCGKF